MFLRSRDNVSPYRHPWSFSNVPWFFLALWSFFSIPWICPALVIPWCCPLGLSLDVVLDVVSWFLQPLAFSFLTFLIPQFVLPPLSFFSVSSLLSTLHWSSGIPYLFSSFSASLWTFQHPHFRPWYFSLFCQWERCLLDVVPAFLSSVPWSFSSIPWFFPSVPWSFPNIPWAFLSVPWSFFCVLWSFPAFLDFSSVLWVCPSIDVPWCSLMFLDVLWYCLPRFGPVSQFMSSLVSVYVTLNAPPDLETRVVN